MAINLVSGGALGSDSVWSFIAEKYGIKTCHLIAFGMKRPSGGCNPQRQKEQSSGYNQYVTGQETNEAIQELINNDCIISGVKAKDYFRGPLTVPQKLHARNYYQVINGDQVLAVCAIVGSNVSGGTATAINFAIKLGKPVYVLNTVDQEWYHYKDGKYIKCDVPHLARRNTCIGTRTLVKYQVLKYGRWVDAPYVGETTEINLRKQMEKCFENI